MKKLLLVLPFLALITLVHAAEAYLTLSYQVLDSRVAPGGETTVFLTLTNPSLKDVGNIKVYLTPGPYLTLTPNYFELSGLSSGSSQQISFNVKVSASASSQISYVKARVEYTVESLEREVTTNIPITIRAEPLLQIANVNFSSTPEPGKRVKLTFSIFNFGEGSAKDLTVRIIQSDIFGVVGASEKFVDEIKPSEFASLSFELIIQPSVEAGIYSIPISLAYKDETRSENYSATKYLDLIVSGSYEFIVTLEDQEILVPGSKGSVEIKVVNAGNQEAKYLTLDISSEYPFAEVFPQKVYVGNLEADDYDTEKISVRIIKDASPNAYPLKIRLSYRDAYGKEYEEEHAVYVKVSSFEELPKPTLLTPLNLAILFLFVAIILYYFFKRRKR